MTRKINSTSSNPGDAEAVRRLLAESGAEDARELGDALLRLRSEARAPAPEPSPELAAFFTRGVTPLKKISRRRGYLLGGAIIAAMAAGTTGVAASNGGLWITAEDAHDVPAPVEYEQVPAAEPAPPAEPEPAPPPALPSAPVETAPAPAVTPVPAEPAREEAGQQTGQPAEPGNNDGGIPGRGSEPGRDGSFQGSKDQDSPGRSNVNEGQGPGNNNGHGFGRDKGQDGPGRSDAGEDGKDGNRGANASGRG
ncbi:hypothetical protein ITX31_11595 [Arthrobacter gandavensis]|uniref:hypothetical protein n=1 Tax=Arthrobacter gandavensis TaxID=169960 RepID=UPI00188F1716|nr:hypothetical protein [Arthrobacter gandavensis]MBF4994750.1 hypothetical protein [Arthrobacter gandavensis]